MPTGHAGSHAQYVRQMRPTRIAAAAALMMATACGGGSSKAAPAGPAAPQPVTSQPSTEASATVAAGTALGSVDACTALTPADFATATDKVQAAGRPASSYTLKTEKTKTDVSAAVDQHAACTYHFSGNPGDSGELTLDVMTAAEYHQLGQFETGKPIAGLGDEAAVYGERPAFLKGQRGVVIANSSSSIAFGKELLRSLAAHF